MTGSLQNSLCEFLIHRLLAHTAGPFRTFPDERFGQNNAPAFGLRTSQRAVIGAQFSHIDASHTFAAKHFCLQQVILTCFGAPQNIRIANAEMFAFANYVRCPELNMSVGRKRFGYIRCARMLDERRQVVNGHMRWICQWDLVSVHLNDARHFHDFLFGPAIDAIEEFRYEFGNTFAVIAPLQTATSFFAMRFQSHQFLVFRRLRIFQQQTSQHHHALVHRMRRKIVLNRESRRSSGRYFAFRMFYRIPLGHTVNAYRPSAPFTRLFTIFDVAFFKPLQTLNAHRTRYLRRPTHQRQLFQHNFASFDVATRHQMTAQRLVRRNLKMRNDVDSVKVSQQQIKHRNNQKME